MMQQGYILDYTLAQVTYIAHVEFVLSQLHRLYNVEKE
jgi:hypothetical protein